jgi:hypothetical protein
MIQKGGNYMFLHTYTFTIGIFPLVLENQCFAGHKHNKGGNIVKRNNSESVNVASAPRKTNKAYPTYSSVQTPV